jgi:adenylate cyclase, class 2
MIEIEVKRRITDERYVPVGPVLIQDDTLFGPPGHDLRILDPKVFLLRIRVTSEGAMLNAKSKGSYGVAREYETSVGDATQARRIIEATGFVELLRFRKERSEREVDGDTLCVDRVEELGCFVELERLVPDGTDPDLATRELEAKLDALGYTGERITKGYDVMIVDQRAANTR